MASDYLFSVAPALRWLDLVVVGHICDLPQLVTAAGYIEADVSAWRLEAAASYIEGDVSPDVSAWRLDAAASYIEGDVSPDVSVS